MAEDKTLWVGGLVDNVTDDHLYELFLQAGPLERVTRAKEKDGTFKKFAFVEFRHAESVPYAIQVMDGIKLFNHHLRLKGRTGSLHDSSYSSSPPAHSHSYHSGSPSSRNHGSSRGGIDYHRSRSFHGGDERKRGPQVPSLILRSSYPGHSKHEVLQSSSDGEERKTQSSHSFNDSAESLKHPFSSGTTFTDPQMKPRTFEDARNRILQKQNKSSSFKAQTRHHIMGHSGHSFNYAQSFSGYSQQPGQQQPRGYPHY